MKQISSKQHHQKVKILYTVKEIEYIVHALFLGNTYTQKQDGIVNEYVVYFIIVNRYLRLFCGLKFLA